jgi:hypothetical protein
MTMYALIYDDRALLADQKAVISVHKSRETAERALKKRQQKLGRRVWECNTRIVWVNRTVRAGESLSPKEFETWRPGEKIPLGDLYSDGD